MKKPILALLAFCLSGIFHCYAQTITVSGFVSDSTQRNIQAVTVVQMRPTDSVALNYVFTDNEGRFRLPGVSSECILLFHHMSYEDYILPVTVMRDTVITVRLKEKSFDISEVTVTAQAVEFRDGKLIVNAGMLKGYDTETTSRILRQLPGVSIDENAEELSLNGRPVQLRLNGRIVQADPMELMKAMPALTLSRIELTANPSAEYETTAGVIDLITRRGVDGYFGRVEGNLIVDRYSGISPDASVFFMLMKRNMYVSSFTKFERPYERSSDVDSTVYNSSGDYMVNKMITKGYYHNVWNNTNISWHIRNKHWLSANLYVYNTRRPFYMSGTTMHENFDPVEVKIDDFYKRWNLSGNLEFETSDNLDYKIKASYGYIQNRDRSRQAYESMLNSVPFEQYDYYNDASGSQHIFKLDFNKKIFRDNVSLSAGLKDNIGHTASDITYKPAGAGDGNEYDYTENLSSAYLTLASSLSPKVYLSGSLRGEYTGYKMDVSGQKGDGDYFYLIPTIGVSYNAGKKFNTLFGLWSTVSRPAYTQLDPSRRYISEDYYSLGNPDLKPTRNYTFGFGNVFFQRVSLNIYGVVNKNRIATVLRDAGNGMTERIPMNAFDYRGIRVSMETSWGFFNDDLYFRLGGAYTYGKYINPQNGFVFPAGRNKQEGFTITGSAGYDITDRLNLYTSLEYTGCQKTIQADTKPDWRMNFFISYYIIRDKLELSIAGYDIFNTVNTRSTTYYDDNVRYQRSKYNLQSVGFSVSYRFQGGMDLKRRQIEDDVNAGDKRFQDR